MHESFKEGLKSYLEKVKNGEIEKVDSIDPIEKAKKYPKSLRSAINAKCYDCTCYLKREVTLCTAKDCPLYKLRPWQRTEKEKE